MNTPEPLMVGGQPVVVGRIVHVVGVNVAGEKRCHAAFIVGVEPGDTPRIKVFDMDSPARMYPYEPLPAKADPASWHWPDANSRQCQGRS